ncbi:ADP-ribosylglycohydrolase [Apiospora saccharicola]
MATKQQQSQEAGVSQDPADHLERIYAGVLGKLIGAYIGRPFEGWSHPTHPQPARHDPPLRPRSTGEPLVVTDDDIAGPFTFIRAIEEHPGTRPLLLL